MLSWLVGCEPFKSNMIIIIRKNDLNSAEISTQYVLRVLIFVRLSWKRRYRRNKNYRLAANMFIIIIDLARNDRNALAK